MTLGQADPTLTSSNNNLLSVNRLTSGKNPSSPTSKVDNTDDSFYKHALLKSCGSGRMIGLGAAKRSFRSKEQLAAEGASKSKVDLNGSAYFENVNSVVLATSTNQLSAGPGSIVLDNKSRPGHANPFLGNLTTSGEGSGAFGSSMPRGATGKGAFLEGSLNSLQDSSTPAEGPPTVSAVSANKASYPIPAGAGKRQSNVSLIEAPIILPTDKLPITGNANNSSTNDNSKSGKDDTHRNGNAAAVRAGGGAPNAPTHQQQLAQSNNNSTSATPAQNIDFLEGMPVVVDITRGPVSLPIGSSIMSVIDNAFLENPTDTAVAFGGFGAILAAQLQRLFLRTN